MTSNQTLRPSFVKLLLAITAISVVLLLAYIFLDILVMLAISVLLSLIFNPFVRYLERWGVSRGLSIFIIVIAAGTVIFSAASYFGPKISEQITHLSTSVNQENIKEFLNNVDRDVTKYVPFVRRGTVSGRIEGFITDSLVNSLDRITNFISSLVSVMAILVIVPFMTFFMLKDTKSILKGILNLVPNKYFEMSYWIANKISTQLGRFARGWILDAFLVGLLVGLGLGMLGINNSILIGIIAGVGHLIPYFGPVIGGIPAIIISAVQFGNFSMFPKILFMLLMVYAVDNGFIQPNVYSKSVDMHPLLIIILMTIGSQLMGIIGLLLAVPLATVIKTAAREIYVAYKEYSIARNRV